MPLTTLGCVDRPAEPRGFHTTQWTVVLAAKTGDGSTTHAALASLCATYWYPLYAFIRRQGASPHEAEDLTQGFFRGFLERNALAHVQPAAGKFRSFLLAMTFSPDSRWLVTSGRDAMVCFWDRATGASYKVHGDSGWFSSLGFSSDGRTLAGGTLNGEVKLWNVGTRREMMTLKGHTTAIGTVAFSADGRTLATTGGETLRLWHAPSLEETDRADNPAP